MTKKKVWKAYAVMADGEICGFMAHFEIHAKRRQAKAVVDRVEHDGLKVVPIIIKQGRGR